MKHIVSTASNLKRTILLGLTLCLLTGAGVAAFTPPSVLAARACNAGEQPDFSKADHCYIPDSAASDAPADSSSNTAVCQNEDCLINRYLKPAIVILSALVAITATGSIIFAGMQYTSARDQSAKVEMAKNRIGITITGVIAWILLLTFLQWLMPGGLF